MGIIANKREFQIYNKYKAVFDDDIFAKPENHYADYTISEMEKLICDKRLIERTGIVDMIKKGMEKIYDKYPDLPKIDDIHSDNIGHVDGDPNDWKIIDYAG
jgi:hypothetical protein